jgi:hypothetical protein
MQGIQHPHQVWNQALPKYKPEASPLEPICSAGLKSAEWSPLALNGDKWQALVNMEMKLWVL